MKLGSRKPDRVGKIVTTQVGKILKSKGISVKRSEK
jgi:hypothetical protein